MKSVHVLAHLAALLAVLVLTYLFLLVSSDIWYRPTEPQGDPDGGAIATLEAWFVAVPIVVVVYLVAVVVTSGLARRRPV